MTETIPVMIKRRCGVIQDQPVDLTDADDYYQGVAEGVPEGGEQGRGVAEGAY